MITPDSASNGLPQGFPPGAGMKDASGNSAPASEPARPAMQNAAPHRPVHTVPEALPATFSSRLFRYLSLAPLISLTLLLALQTVFSLNARDLWFSDEVRHANAFENLLHHGKWLILEMNGQPYPDKPPLYFWFLRGLYALLRDEGPRLYFTAAAVSGALYLWASLALGKFVARVDRRTLFASGLALLVSGYVYGAMHYARMDLLFSAAILCAHVALYQALIRERASGLMLLAFILMALGTLIKGPLAMLLPLVAGAVFVCWQGRPGRLLRKDALLGFLALLVILGAWAGAVAWQSGGMDFILNEVLKKQVALRAVDTFHHKESWHYYLVRLPLAWLPWTMLILFLPWHRFLNKNMRTAIAASRTPEKDGLAYLWIMVLSGLAILSLLSGKILIYFLPVFPALALLTGRAVLQLSGWRAPGFRYALAVVLVACAAGVALAQLVLSGSLPMPDIAGLPAWRLARSHGAFIIAGVLLVCACLLCFGLKKSRPEGVLLILALTSLAVTYPVCNMLAPSLDPVMSPKAQALRLKEFADAGYYPASFKEYSGTYAYYAKHDTHMLDSLEQADALLSSGKKLILALRASHWDKWTDRPQCLREVHRQWIVEREYVLAACPLNDGNGPVTETPPAGREPNRPEEPTATTNATIPTGAPLANASLPASNGTLPGHEANARSRPEGESASPAVSANSTSPDNAATPPASPGTVNATSEQGAAPVEQPAPPEGHGPFFDLIQKIRENSP